ncbi:hypothetical protein D9619_008802 [Psilocybe cf. subviscida]|uniref:DUF6535 domain-containing protein n=1 Tax=Psilocybe cf. subviscida TaxID=2480587 RepID=A0A8H5F0S3_9AGAR|nr:hypothetical protein D9619_008802 [Psilocybe cf. subviscida]
MPGGSYYPSSSNIRVNICWFISLILSLMTVLIGIVGLQWIREYQKYPTNLPPKRAFAARNLRAEGLEEWYVPEIFAGLPLLLQSALVLFLVGLNDFLLHLNIIVAWPAIAMTSATLLFLIVTTILPPIQTLWLLNTAKSMTIPAPCPYKSPQSWAFFRIMSSWSFRFALNLVGDASFYILVAPVSAIALVNHVLGGRDRLWTWISYLHLTLKLKSLGSL